MIAKLIPLDGSPPIPVLRDVTVVGRKQGLCDIVLDHSSISKIHCLIAKTDGLLFFRDIGSTNGTKVNGQRVMRGALLPNDELAFAALRFRVHLGPGEPEVDPDDRTEMFDLPPREEVASFSSDMTFDSAEDSEAVIDSAFGEK
jgi:pSer/pThr/pTyr-binding forkhead associated (FHA) protein